MTLLGRKKYEKAKSDEHPPKMWIFSFRLKTPFLGKFGPKIKIVSLSWNLVPRPIRICRIQWWCSLFLPSTRNNPFWVNLVQKIKIVSFSWNLVPALIWISKNQCWSSLFPFSIENTLFGGNFVFRLIRICIIQWWCWLSLFSTKNAFLGKFGPQKQDFQFKLKFGN